MLELQALADMFRAFMEGRDVVATEGFRQICVAMTFIIPASVIGGLIAAGDWHETPLGQWLGLKAPDDSWAVRARDLDKDGQPDF
jgi:hypothetical protein